jgi:signal transduction histidine kinase
VDVEDTGIGISKEYMDNLFKPFSQEDIGYNRRYDGNGLGLAITKEYLRLNHANISVKSEKGKGTIFTVTFYHHLEDDKFDNQSE